MLPKTLIHSRLRYYSTLLQRHTADGRDLKSRLEGTASIPNLSKDTPSRFWRFLGDFLIYLVVGSPTAAYIEQFIRISPLSEWSSTHVPQRSSSLKIHEGLQKTWHYPPISILKNCMSACSRPPDWFDAKLR